MPTLGFRLFALATALAAWALVIVGGLVRVSESGLGCPDWPLCHGRVIPADRTATVIEYAHRATATVVTVLVVATLIWAVKAFRGRRDIVVPALVAAIFVPFQAVLGAVVVWLELPGWIVAFHFVIGLLFLAATVVTAARAWGRPARATRAFLFLAWTGVGAALALVALGAAVVAAGEDDACGRDWPACNGSFAGDGSLAGLQVAHRSLAYAVAALAVVLAVLAVRGAGPRAAGVLPLALVCVQVGFGIGVVLTDEHTFAHHSLEVLHVAGAGAVWAAFVAVASFAARADLGGSPVSRAAVGTQRRRGPERQAQAEG